MTIDMKSHLLDYFMQAASESIVRPASYYETLPKSVNEVFVTNIGERTKHKEFLLHLLHGVVSHFVLSFVGALETISYNSALRWSMRRKHMQ